MKRLKTTLAAALISLVAATAGSSGQGTVRVSMSPEEQQNLRLAAEWARVLIRERRFEEADKYMAPDYIQHNPIIQTGREGFVTFFSGSRAAEASQIGRNSKRVIEFAKGPYVVWVNEAELTDQNGAPYTFNWFDMVRVENGRIAEHWDSFIREAPAPGQPAPARTVQGVGPRPIKPRNTPEEQANEDIANVLFKDILQYGHLELTEKVMAPGYIQHNPNVPTGRRAFMDFFSRFAKPEPIRPVWKDEPELILTNGNIVFYRFRRFSADPSDPSQIYKWNWYDVVRVDEGRIQEHWDSARKTPPPASVSRPAGFREYR